jgi:hypothetical protein
LAIREQDIKAAVQAAGECTGGPADTFETARAVFELAWAVFHRSVPKPTFEH